VMSGAWMSTSAMAIFRQLAGVLHAARKKNHEYSCVHRLHMRNCFAAPLMIEERDDFLEGTDT